jgi:ATP-binding cassette, subfamily B, bacterial
MRSPEIPHSAEFPSVFGTGRWAIRMAWADHAPQLSGLAVLTAARGLLPAAAALVMRELINAVVAAARVPPGRISPVLPWLALALGLTVAEIVTGFLHKYLAQRFYDDVDLSVTARILDHAGKLDLGFFEDPRFQDVIHRAQQNTAMHFSRFVVEGMTFCTQVLQSVSLIAILASIDPLTVFVLVPLVLPHVWFQWRLSKKHYLKEQIRTTKRRWSQYFVSLLTSQRSVPEVKLLGMAPIVTGRFRALMAEFRDQNREIFRSGFVGDSVCAVVITAAFYAVFAGVCVRFLNGALRIGDVVVFGTAGLRFRSSLETVVSSISSAIEHALYISNLRHFLGVAPGVTEGEGLTPPAGRGEIEFQDVTFTYPGSVLPAFSNVSFHLKAGETVAFVGKNGAGKTTLAKLVARLYEPQSGRILVDGVDVRQWPLDFLHAQIAFVFQNYGRYEATAADNIAYGDWRRLLENRCEVERIARYAGIDDVVGKMPQGYDTLLGRKFGEYDLSDGQWQKIALARALARNASVLVLDEPTSNLDAAAEYDLFCRFRDLAHGRTTILISHRFSTVKMADRIIVLEQGRILESGTHQELLAAGGHYSKLYALQQFRTDATDEPATAAAGSGRHVDKPESSA